MQGFSQIGNMGLRSLVSDLRDSLERPPREQLTITLLPIVSCLVIVIAISALMTCILQDPDEFAERFAAKYEAYAYIAIFLITLLSSLTIFLPAPGTAVVIALISTLNLDIPLAALVGSLGGTLGEISAYWLGYMGRGVIRTEDSERFQTAQRWMGRHGGWTIFVFALVPFLFFDLAGIAAGALKYPVKRFLLFCWLGRLPRAFLEYTFGATVLDLILDHLPWKT